MKLLVIEHDIHLPVATLGRVLNDCDIDYDIVRFKEGKACPDLDDYAGLIVMGGDELVWEEDKYPWLIKEKALIHEAVSQRNLPYLGICLGHQLLADVMGGKVETLAAPTMAVCPISLNATAAIDPIFNGVVLGQEDNIKSVDIKSAEIKSNQVKQCGFRCFRLNSAGVSKLPPNSECLAQSDDGMVQVMRVGKHAYGIQGHIEVMANDIDTWAKIPSVKAYAQLHKGEHAIDLLRDELKQNEVQIETGASLMMRNFIAQIKAY